jgi:hypothetical protein
MGVDFGGFKYLGFYNLAWVRFATMKFDVSKNPITVGLLGTISVVVVAQNLTHLVHQL